ncbi:hypothetical protein Tsubulata_024544 [Turnera subulata]|uniref:Uncharacterized protein n=1 Tax=Turnera subulata TaxID=218843 RepID=A0A9Q0JJ98_9ROSI|nr:hypothetical protein Tsubulata_024544 [Turnera subulata]
MCYRVNCKQCGKISWGGCGNHLPGVYNSIEKGQHCMCKSWPGVVIPPEEKATLQQPLVPQSASTTAGVQKA